MENKIRLLPEIVANQIAAGEVVDNPASAIKEMMENSIDAGASSLTVNFRNAGLELIQIVDDGCGMSPMDARMAFDRHATSKIETFEDVYRLQTFGFRGEALASIAAVAQVELRTRQAEDEVGTVTIVNGGEFVSQTPTMCPVGSQFMVRNLFYTAPARRKFNSDRTKMVNEIKKVFRQVALCNPQVRCELMSNDMPIITLPAGSLLERIIGVVGRHIKTNLLEVDVDTSIVKVKGYVGRPSAAKQKNTEQYLFVNGRFFRSPQIYRAIMKAYEKLIPEKDSPSYFLYLTLDPERVDVNVSPHKTEVRFADAEDVNQIVNAAVRSTLAKSGSVAMMDFENSTPIDIPVLGDTSNVVYAEPKSSTNSDYNPFREDYIETGVSEEELKTAFDDPFMELPYRRTSQPAKQSAKPSSGRLSDVSWTDMAANTDFAIPSAEEFNSVPSESYREIASDYSQGIDLAAMMGMEEESSLEFVASAVQQSLECEQKMEFSSAMPLVGGYVLAQSGGRSMLVDMRRAKERILYDSYMAMIGAGSMASQRLLFPERLTLSEDDFVLLSENEVEFAALGFELNLVGDGVVELNAIPSSIVGEQADEVLYELLREVESGDVAEHMRSNMARVMAVKGSRLSSKGITAEEAMEVLQHLCACDNYSFSPSGKAIMAEFTIEDIKAKLN
ncbi:MAG: DNA mismatch repair endonuclease MutL [Alistipes sp.]|nr:DNA mismatch repair endonuclease MutL [Alistipes sp.]MBP3601884.1 DNA mismatch repair endonuclease MutL [Alistipes sp.]